ncbi:hypothetical protein Z043_108396, partial [Scleropages formosus]
CLEKLKALLQDADNTVRVKTTEVLYLLAAYNLGRGAVLKHDVVALLSDMLDEPVDACRKNVHRVLELLAQFPAAQANVFEVVLYDDIRYGIKHKLDVAGVRGAGEVRVDLLGLLVAVEVLELALDVDCCLLVRVLALVLRKAERERDALDLLSQQVFFVEEEDERGVNEPVVVADGVKETQAFSHPALQDTEEDISYFGYPEVIATELYTKYDGCHSLEAVDPLLPLRALTTYIHHLESQLLEGELVLHNACGHIPRSQDIFHCGDVLWGGDAPFHNTQQLWCDLAFALRWPCQSEELHSIIGPVRVVKVNLQDCHCPDNTCQ